VKKYVVKILFGLGFFVAAYVLYAHVAALHAVVLRSGEHPWTTRFSEPSAFQRDFATDRSADFDVDARVGAVGVVRNGAPGDGHATFRSKAFHFDGGRTRVEFRVAERAAYDVFVGLERADQPEKRLAVVLRNDPEKPSFRLEGTDGLRGPTPQESLLEYVDGDAIMRDPGVWHTLGLRFEPTSQETEISIDDVPVASHLVGWTGGFDARVVFGVRDRHADAVHVDFAEIEWLPQAERELERLPDLDERFLGVRLDPVRWNVFLDKDWRADGSVSPYETGNGLLLHAVGTSQSAAGVMQPIAICTLPFSLTPTRVEVDWDALDLDHADAFVSLTNLAATRNVEVALANRGGADKQIVIRGQLDGKFLQEEFDGPKLASGKAHLLLVYDSWFRTLRVSIDDVKVFDHAFGLQRAEFVHACVGEHVSPGGHANVVLTRFHLHRAPY
jgi:hypothetical protein